MSNKIMYTYNVMSYRHVFLLRSFSYRKMQSLRIIDKYNSYLMYKSLKKRKIGTPPAVVDGLTQNILQYN